MKARLYSNALGPVRVRNRVRIVAVLGLLVLATVGATFGGRAAAQDADSSDFTGSWRVMITPEGGPTFGGLSSYHDDGTIVSSILPVAPPMPGGPDGVAFNGGGHGSIEDDGAGGAVITIVHLRANGEGMFIGAFTVRAVIALDQSGDRFTGEFQGTVTDPGGNVVMTVTGTVEGTRILAEPPLAGTPTS